MLLFFGIALSVPGATSDSDAVMTRAKLAVDLGDRVDAERALESLAGDASVPDGTRAEAYVRLAILQRAAGKSEASLTSFRKAMESPGRDADVTRMIALAIGGIVPEGRRWAEHWSEMQLRAEVGADGQPSIEWPRAPGDHRTLGAVDPVTLDVESMPLVEFLFKLLSEPPPAWGRRHEPATSWPKSYQPPESLRGIEFVLHTRVGDRDDPKVTVQVSNMPWKTLFENVLVSNGLDFRLDQNLLVIARPADLPAFEHIRRQAYGGERTSLMWFAGDPSVLTMFHDVFAASGVSSELDAGVKGPITLRLHARPSLEVLDWVLTAQDLVVTRDPGAPGAKALRVSRRADAVGEPVDIARLVAPRLRQPWSIWAVDLDAAGDRVTGPPRLIAPHSLRGIALSPDGQWVAFMLPHENDSSFSVWLQDLKSGNRKKLLDAADGPARLAARPDGNAVFYPSRDGIVSLPVSGGAPTTVCSDCATQFDSQHRIPDFVTGVSPDGGTLVLQHGFGPNAHPTLMVLDVPSGRREEILRSEQRSVYRGQFSPDGRWLVFHTGIGNKFGNEREFIAPYHGLRATPESEWIAVTNGRDWVDSPAWSPDGNSLYYVSNREVPSEPGNGDSVRHIWAQRLDPRTKAPIGEPTVLFPASTAEARPFEFAVGNGVLLFVSDTADAGAPQ
jgi:hypothetical protein